MERGEPTFVPEWYKPSGSSASGSNSNQHRASNNSLAAGSRANHHGRTNPQSGEHISGFPSRNRPAALANACNHDTPRFADRGPSSFRRSASSNGYMSHDNVASGNPRMYSSFGRSHRDVDKGRGLALRDITRSLLPQNELYDSFKSICAETDTLRRSRSMISGQRADLWSRGPGKEDVNNNGAHSGGSVTRNICKASFERDFPSLGADDKQGQDLSRVTSPGPSSALQSLPVSASDIAGGNGWTSALAVVPVKVGGNGPVPHSAKQTCPVSLPSMCTPTGLNMAEALVQAPPRARNNPQLSVDSRNEELALKQYTKLIPVTPSTSKSTILNSSDKAKSRGKGGDLTTTTKVGQLSSSQLVNQTLAPTRAGIPKIAQAGNFQVLNRERNGILHVAKDGPNPTNATRVVTPLSGVPSAAVPLRIPNDPKANADSKRRILTSTQSSFGEKRPQVQNRNDFFNSIRKKSSANQSAASETSCIPPSSSGEASQQSNGISSSINQGDNSASSHDLGRSPLNGNDVSRVHDACQQPEKPVPDDTDNSSFESDDEADGEYLALLLSFGWDKNAEGGALTTEEIDNFIKKYGDIPMKRGYRNPRPLKINASVSIRCGTGSLSASISSDSEKEA